MGAWTEETGKAAGLWTITRSSQSWLCRAEDTIEYPLYQSWNGSIGWSLRIVGISESWVG